MERGEKRREKERKSERGRSKWREQRRKKQGASRAEEREEEGGTDVNLLLGHFRHLLLVEASVHCVEHLHRCATKQRQCAGMRRQPSAATMQHLTHPQLSVAVARPAFALPLQMR
eukprot:3901230-Rhodomonas_salina.1